VRCTTTAPPGRATALSATPRALHRAEEKLTALREEFGRQVKKGKLSESATAPLKAWVAAHFAWPYPSVRDWHWVGQAGLGQSGFVGHYRDGRKARD
jgi:hypothetical protein